MIAQNDRAAMTAVTTVDGTWEFGETFHVQFNPETLEITSTSKIEEDKGEKQNKTPVQVVAGTERRLSVQLIFDETLTGNDVRNQTSKIVGMMRAGENTLDGYGARGADKDVMLPSVVLFEWGNLSFQGTIGECTETLEYFSPTGIPLRASMKFSLTEQDAVFAEETGAGAPPPNDGINLPPDQPLPPGRDVQQAAADNGVESPRHPETDSLHVADTPETANHGSSIRGALGASAKASLQAGPGGLSASAGASLGGGGGASFGLPAASIASGRVGLGVSAGAGLGISADIGGGVSLRGGGGLDLGAAVGDAGGVSLGGEADLGLGLDAFSGLKDASASLSGGAATLKGGLGQIGVKAGASSGGGGALFTAKAEVGAKVDLGALLFPEDTA